MVKSETRRDAETQVLKCEPETSVGLYNSSPRLGPPKIRARDALNQKSELDNLIKSNKSGYHALSVFRNSQKLTENLVTKFLTKPLNLVLY